MFRGVEGSGLKRGPLWDEMGYGGYGSIGMAIGI